MRQSIVRFAAELSKVGGVQAETIKSLCIWLILAPALAHLEEDSPVPFRGFMRRQLLLGTPEIDVGRILSTVVIESGRLFSALKMPALSLCENLKRTTTKGEGEQARTRADFADGQVWRRPLLQWFASSNRLEEVELLLSKGAPVDQLDGSGGSALLCAIQEAIRTGDHRVLNSLLACPHSNATLESVTTKKPFTPLLCEVEFGEPDVVERLLTMGADADLRGNIINETPLYLALTKMGEIRNPGTPGRTPLMLAAEINSVWAFDLMIRHGGDPLQTDAAGADCPKIAIGFSSAEVVGYMRSNRIV